jgi:hypothetical protein
MWIWILVFARARNPDVFPDRAWAARAEIACKASRERLNKLPNAKDFKNVTPKAEALRQRADVADKVTAEVRARIAALRADAPADDKTVKGLALWFADWDVYFADRDTQVARWRSGVDKAFEETKNAQGQPNSIRVDPFAVTNKMPSCTTPNDLG